LKSVYSGEHVSALGIIVTGTSNKKLHYWKIFLRTEMLTTLKCMLWARVSEMWVTWHLHHVILNMQHILVLAKQTNAYIGMKYMGYKTQIAQDVRRFLNLLFPNRIFSLFAS